LVHETSPLLVPGASAYSVTKAGVTQLARVAALELAPFGVRVNILHPDAVFDTEIWTDEALEKSAKRYGMTVQEYKTKNLLSTEITSSGVAALVSTVAGPVFSGHHWGPDPYRRWKRSCDLGKFP
jgi:NAD(P)-dependent dehydrogenase (short-subunit alcohol dehydrogenase family)